MPTTSEIEQAAQAIFDSREQGRAIPQISQTFGVKDAESAYAVQEINTKRWVQQGRRVVGRKIGLTAKAIQQQLGVDQPDYGMLWADGGYEDGQSVPMGKMISPRIEAEIAFIMKKGVGENVTLQELEQAIDVAIPCVEIVDSAIADWKITLADTIADNASAAGYMLGKDRKKLAGLDLRLCGMVISKGEENVSLGVGAACLGHPLIATQWLAKTMAKLGRPLGEGDLVLSGALGPMVGAKAGDVFKVEIQGFSPFSVPFQA